MRVTQMSMSMTALAGLQNDLAALATTQEQLSTGRVINKPSDNPAGTVVDLQVRSAIARNNQYGVNAQDGIGWLGTADTALTGVTSDLQRARTLVVQAQNGAMGSTSLQALAAELDAVTKDVLQQANTTYNNQPIFAGTSGVSAAYDSTGAYQGDTNSVMRQVSDQTRVAVSLPGTTVFGAAGSDVFTVLHKVTADVTGNPSALSADLSSLDGILNTVSSAHSQIGAAYNRVQNAQTTASTAVTNLTTQQAQVEDADIAKTVTNLSSQQVAYQAALSATAKAIQPSLLQFLA